VTAVRLVADYANASQDGKLNIAILVDAIYANDSRRTTVRRRQPTLSLLTRSPLTVLEESLKSTTIGSNIPFH
jgi:hypothetical protein